MSQRLADVDLESSMTKLESLGRIEVAQRRLLQLRLTTAGLIGSRGLGPGILVLLEGADASGKGGAIKRLVAPIDPRHVTVAPFAAPTEREFRHHFLWRFVPSIPGLGGMSIFDRTWYGRVLVERVEQITPEAAWRRGYKEINDFEASLTAEGVIIIKLFLQISAEEQLRRFEQRKVDPLKSWKLTDEDWRNREKLPAYEEAIDEMFAETDTDWAPWHVIGAESKHLARVLVLEAVNKQIEVGMRRFGMEPPAHDEIEIAR